MDPGGVDGILAVAQVVHLGVGAEVDDGVRTLVFPGVREREGEGSKNVCHTYILQRRKDVGPTSYDKQHSLSERQT